MPDVLAARGAVCWCPAGKRVQEAPVPGAVGVPGQAALRTGAAICLALVQLQPDHAQPRATYSICCERDTEQSRGESELHTEAARLSAPSALLRPLTFASLSEPLECIPRTKNVYLHVIYIGPSAKGVGEMQCIRGLLSMGLFRPFQQQTFCPLL